MYIALQLVYTFISLKKKDYFYGEETCKYLEDKGYDTDSDTEVT